jgi:hypothetical protein
MHNEDYIEDDIDIYLMIERGHYGTINAIGDIGSGDRIVASKTRVTGKDQLRPLILHLFDAFRAGGWKDGNEISAVVMDDKDDYMSGRDWALRDALGVAIIKARTDDSPETNNLNKEAAELILHSDLPEEAVKFDVFRERRKDTPTWLSVYIKYISDGTATSGVSELATVLRNNGISVSGD